MKISFCQSKPITQRTSSLPCSYGLFVQISIIGFDSKKNRAKLALRNVTDGRSSTGLWPRCKAFFCNGSASSTQRGGMRMGFFEKNFSLNPYENVLAIMCYTDSPFFERVKKK